MSARCLSAIWAFSTSTLYDYRGVYGVDFKADKAERVDYGHSLMTHAMVFTGVDLDDAGQPLKWRVENSWGDKIGDKGFLVMSDGWFEQYMYEIVVDKRFIPEPSCWGSWKPTRSCCRPGIQWARWRWPSRRISIPNVTKRRRTTR